MSLTNRLFVILFYVWNIHILSLSPGVSHMIEGDLRLVILTHHAILELILVVQSIHPLQDKDVIPGMYIDWLV